MKELSKKSYWDGVHRDKSIITKNLIHIPLIQYLLLGFHNWEFFHICRKYISSQDKNIFEVWCAPWNYLLQFARIFSLSPSGIEYSPDWVEATEKNFALAWVKAEIIFGDFFDPKFHEEHGNSYDITYSVGFIEHFDDPSDTISKHFSLAKSWWLVICTIPNLPYLNKYLVEQKVLDIHNLDIMHLDVLRKYFREWEILHLGYFGWIFNAWAFAYKNPILEKLRMWIFIIQRLILDPIFILFRKLSINFANKYTSPSIIIVARKK